MSIVSILTVWLIAIADIVLTINLVGGGIAEANPVARILLGAGAAVYATVRVCLLIMYYGMAIRLGQDKTQSMTVEGTTAVIFFAHIGLAFYWVAWLTT